MVHLKKKNTHLEVVDIIKNDLHARRFRLKMAGIPIIRPLCTTNGRRQEHFSHYEDAPLVTELQGLYYSYLVPYRRKLLHQLFLFFVCLLSYECICIMYLLEPFNFKNYPWYECTTLYEKSRNFVQIFLLEYSLMFQIFESEGGKNLALNVDTKWI